MLKLESIFLYNSAKKELILYKSLSEFYIKVFCNRSGKRYIFFRVVFLSFHEIKCSFFYPIIIICREA